VRGLILGLASGCFAAALAVAGAAVRLPSSPPTRTVPLAVVPGPPPVAARATSAAELQPTIDGLAREQVASRELVAELRATVDRLQEALARQSAPSPASGPPGRTLTVLSGDLLPAGKELLGSGAGDVVRSVLPEIMADPRQIVSVEGHSDSRPIHTPTGKPFKNNADLSLLRARFVAGLLRQNGVAAGRIRVKGWGDTRPLDTNDNAAGRDRNRRVEIRLLPPAPGN
jgi:outer membrane protein OmpA-like peptidoglycan-associated protein